MFTNQIEMQNEVVDAIRQALTMDGQCMLDTHCITCSDEALPVRVLAVDETTALAEVEIAGAIIEVDISLMQGVTVGQWLLVHGGVALESVDAQQVEDASA